MLNQLLFFSLFSAIAAICWKCEIHRSILVLLVILGIALCACATKEYFYQEKQALALAPAPSVPITNATLMEAGIVRPSVFNCADQIGITAEMNSLFAFKEDL
jgi:hypothetical protein